ncbi:MAG: hypothetical protein AAF916_08830 [Planctomycetota bacterium]
MFMGIRNGVLLASLLCSGLPVAAVGQSDPANFATVINLPEDQPIIFGQINSDTQLNVATGGTVARGFNAGATNGSSANVEVNVLGGLVQSGFNASPGSVLNVVSGTVEEGLEVGQGAKVNVVAGTIEGNSLSLFSDTTIGGGLWQGDHAYASGTTIITGGTFEGQVLTSAMNDLTIEGGRFESLVSVTGASDATITDGDFGVPPDQGPSGLLFQIGEGMISGGTIQGLLSIDSGSTVDVNGGAIDGVVAVTQVSTLNLSGGAVAEDAGFAVFGASTLNLFGSDFRINGFPLFGPTPGIPFAIDLRDVTLSATLTDGSFFSFDLNSELVQAPDTNYIGPASFVNVTLIEAVGLAGDLSGDSAVDQSDLNLVLNNWGQSRGNWSNADGFATASVDQEELNAVLNNWGASSSPSSLGATLVPEPGSAVAVFTGLAALQRRFRKDGRR